ncbi:hypothetical protein [Neobacillus vireti]|uniref:Copper amine oxidase-like N-terminal domain-containing protein n=1 Tax=Neobacillus vireti LMG 21834 TaxID=1131730 RepID=A0AB94IMM4_9BACI|nr:hypothetical protein [Neobacillus vireti]ETI68252.1 hypothetical protein BAVI_13359 [Neobacillus vireti LMG 21834]KLT17731.1 hypothetical protein AA980_11520 [Neobacillus vireti]
MKIKWFLSIFVVLLITIVPVASAVTPFKVFVNGQPIFGIPSIVQFIDGLPFVSIESICIELKLDVEYDSKNRTLHISNIGEPQSEVVATLKKANATLYATKREGHLEKFRLKMDGGIRWFPYWRSTDAPAFGPKLFFEDINQDGKEELVIVLTTDHGTGIMITEAHVLQKTKTNIGEIFEERLIDNPVAIINKNVKTKLVSNDQVEITIGKKKKNDTTYDYLKNERIEYSVYKNELVVYISGHIFPPTEGGILITYQFKDNMYQAKKIEYLKKRPDFKMESSFQ